VAAEFSAFEERNIILLALDSPDFFYRIATFIDPGHFEDDLYKYIISIYKDYFDKYDVIPSREALKDIAYRDLKGDDDLAEPVIKILNEEIDPRNYPYIKDNIIAWAKKRQYSLLYDEKTMDAIKNGDTEIVEKIVSDAAKISDVIIKPFRFFDDIDNLFIKNVNDYFTTGFSRLDSHIHDGGLHRREVFVWVAPTGVGKSLMLVNTALSNVNRGRKVLHISLENSEEVTGCRYLGAFTNSIIANRFNNKDVIKSDIRKLRTSSNGELFIIYFPTDTVSVNEVELSLRELSNKYGFVPDVIILDYLECLLSKNPYKNREDYSRQKSVACEIRALASTTNTVIFTASQTNRSGVSGSEGDKNISLDKIAESFGKAMPLDVCVSINQSQKEYDGDSTDESHIGYVRLFIAKNRNGPRHKVINASIDYYSMKATQEEVQ